ncbi:MAG: TM2 domain-containing protein [Mycoplasmatales bacterium]
MGKNEFENVDLELDEQKKEREESLEQQKQIDLENAQNNENEIDVDYQIQSEDLVLNTTEFTLEKQLVEQEIEELPFIDARTVQNESKVEQEQQNTSGALPNETNFKQVEVEKITGKKYSETLLLAFFAGYTGIHRMLNKQIGLGVLMFLTCGGCGIWQLVDIVLLLTNKFKNSDGQIIGYEKNDSANTALGFAFLAQICFSIFMLIIYFVFLFLIFATIISTLPY